MYIQANKTEYSIIKNLHNNKGKPIICYSWNSFIYLIYCIFFSYLLREIPHHRYPEIKTSLRKNNNNNSNGVITETPISFRIKT